MSYKKEFLKELREERTNYKDMIDFCCDSLILNNDIISELAQQDYYFDLYCGSESYFVDNNGDEITQEQAEEMNFDEYEEIYFDFYQYFIISSQDAERIAEYTNETVYYNDKLDLYLLAVSHYGTSWSCVPSNWKELDEVED